MHSKSSTVVHLTTVHPRDDIRIFHKECRSLAAAGLDVVLVVGDGLGDESRDGVRVVDIGPRPASRIRRMWSHTRLALTRVQSLKPALVHFHDPELLPVGVYLQRHGIQCVYDAHEDVPRQILTKHWIPTPIRSLVSALFEHYEDRQARQLHAVVAATPHIEARFSRLGVQALTIANYPFPQELASSLEATANREATVCYVGGISRARGALELVKAIARVPSTRLLLCGRIEDEALKAELESLPGWSQVEYLGHVDREGVRQVMARSRVGLVTLLPLPSYQDAWPIKMFEYMSAGLPVLASNFSLWRSIVEDTGAGVCVEPTNPDAIAAALNDLLADPVLCQAMGEAGRLAVKERYHWSREEKRLVAQTRAWLVGAAEPK
jgi:glycosyltransferase involved in cell wall biosynthesis